jgi:hypothetical protein
MDQEQRVAELFEGYKSGLAKVLGDLELQTVAESSLALREMLRDVGRDALQAKVDIVAEGLASATPDACCAGAALPLVHTRRVGVKTLLGEISVPVRTFRCKACREYRRPDDAVLGLPESGEFTDDVRALLAPLAAELPHRTAIDLLERATAARLSPRGAQGVIESSARDVRRRREQREVFEDAAVREERQAIAEGRSGASLALEISMDGVMSHVDRSWHEAKLATVLVRRVDPTVATKLDDERLGEVLARRYTCVLGGPQELGARVQELIRQAGWEDLPVAEILGDGAPWIWNLAQALWPGVRQTLDRWHLRQHFYEYATPQFADAARAKRDALLEDRVGDVLSALKRSRPKRASRGALDGLVGYVERNQDRISYSAPWNAGFAVGSGSVEGACKHLVKARFKRAGMRWKRKGFLEVLELRIARLNNTLDGFWRSGDAPTRMAA